MALLWNWMYSLLAKWLFWHLKNIDGFALCSNLVVRYTLTMIRHKHNLCAGVYGYLYLWPHMCPLQYTYNSYQDKICTLIKVFYQDDTKMRDIIWRRYDIFKPQIFFNSLGSELLNQLLHGTTRSGSVSFYASLWNICYMSRIPTEATQCLPLYDTVPFTCGRNRFLQY